MLAILLEDLPTSRAFVREVGRGHLAGVAGIGLVPALLASAVLARAPALLRHGGAGARYPRPSGALERARPQPEEEER